MEISFAEPGNKGDPLTGVFVEIKTKLGEFMQSNECDASLQLISGTYSCKVSFLHLRQSPFNLERGDLIIARVRALNIIGMSDYSQINTDGSIV